MATTFNPSVHASKCLEAWTSGDFDVARSLLSDDVTFDGPLGHTEGADAYIDEVAQMFQDIKGVTLTRTMVEGDDVCLMYDLVTEDSGSLPTVGWYHFSDDKIDHVRAYFDPRPLSGPPRREAFEIPLFAAALQLCEPLESEIA
jgi:SnoaL-like protein